MKKKNTLLKILINFFKLILIVLLVGIGYLNYSLYYNPKFVKVESDYYNQDVYHQLQFLKDALRNGAGAQMQDLFPEGFLFINALYGLTWVNLIEKVERKSILFEEGMEEINWSMEEINSSRGKQNFEKDLPLEYGVFYKGWSNYLLANKLKIQSIEERDSLDLNLFIQNCNQISIAIKQSDTPYLESYSAQIWPADMVVAIASLNLHDQIWKPRFQDEIKEWIKKVKQLLDPKTNLIPHKIYGNNREVEHGVRGSSQSLILNFLIDIDEEFAKEQFEIYKSLFLTSRFGLPGIREYPKGINGIGDIDSGPVILNVGGAASIVGQRTMGKFKDWNTYQGLRNSIEGFGLAYTSKSMKKYIFGQLPMADAFIAWSNSIETTRNQVKPKSNWRIYFQLLSISILILLGYLIRKL